MAASRNGFIPSREPTVDWIRNVYCSAQGTETIAKGDAVVRVAGVCTRASAGQDPVNAQGFGVVIAVYTTANRPLTFQTTKYIGSAGVGRADVCYDPDQTYYVQCVTAVAVAKLGTNVVIDQSAANALTGISGQSVDIPTSSSTNDYFKLINIGPFDSLSGPDTGSATNNGVEVRWNNHFLHSPTKAQ